MDSTRLPRYVRPTGDSLQLGGGTLAYAVEMVQLKEGPSNAPHTLYFVAEVGDSLYYREIEDSRPHDPNPTHFRIRSLRTLDVPEATTNYIWFEHAKYGESRTDSTVTRERWRAHVFTYDKIRGIRFLQWAPIRYEERKNGILRGVRQLDVRFPEAGIMEIEERLQKGARVTRGMGWNHRLGWQVIDPEAVERDEDDGS